MNVNKYFFFFSFFFFFNDTATTEIYTLSLHDALPIWPVRRAGRRGNRPGPKSRSDRLRSEEHTSELQSRRDLVCRLLLEKKRTEKQESEEIDGIMEGQGAERVQVAP